MSVIVRNTTVTRDQNIVFDNYFAVAGDRNIVSNECPIPDTQNRFAIEPAGSDREAAADADVIADIEGSVSTDAGQRYQLQALSDGLAPAGEHRGGIEQRFQALPQNGSVEAHFVEETSGGLEISWHRIVAVKQKSRMCRALL